MQIKCTLKMWGFLNSWGSDLKSGIEINGKPDGKNKIKRGSFLTQYTRKNSRWISTEI